MKYSVSLIIGLVCSVSLGESEKISATDAFQGIYDGCLSQYSYSCVKPKALAWMSKVADDDVIKISECLSIVRNAPSPVYDPEDESRHIKDKRFQVLDRLDEFLATHTLRIKVPAEVTEGQVSDLVPRSLLRDLPREFNVPLTDNTPAEGRGFVKKVLVPFLLGLKFKASVLVPLALALIALKTWKALTLGLISLVLSGAMVIFKFTKPKIVNYEVIHYPQHHVEHHVPAGWDGHQHGHGHGPYQQRALGDSHEMAYGGQI